MSKAKPHPPKAALRFFKWFCEPQLHKYLEGDLLELFERNTKQKGLFMAKTLFLLDVLKLLRPSLIKTANGGKLNYYGMLKNYFITSIRFIKREKAFALMNVSGLAMGIACALIIYKILDHEFSFDKHHLNYDRIHRVNKEDLTTEGNFLSRGQNHPLADALRNEFPAIKATMTYYNGEGLIAIDDGKGNLKRFQEKEGVAFVEPQFLEIFTVQFLHGDPATALDQPGKVILTASSASKYFGVTEKNLSEAIGKAVILENEQTSYVTAIIEDRPKSTEFPFEVIFHYQDQGVVNPWFYDGKSWGEYGSAINCFVMLSEDVYPSEFEKQLEPFARKYLNENLAEKRRYRLQPFAEIHYSEKIRRTYAGVTATKNELIVLGLVGFFLIITACINFINLSTAQAVKRSKEVGVRKTMGSGKRQLIVQFLCETFVITFLATVVGFLIAYLMSDRIESIFDNQISIDLLSDQGVILFVIALIFGVTLFAGLYPSITLAKMNPVLAIKNSLNVKSTSGFLSLRRALVVLQFSISQILVIGILILNAQMNFFQTKDLGFNDDSIVVVKLPENDATKLKTLKNQLLNHSSIEGVSFGSSGPMSSWRSTNPISHPNTEGRDLHGNLKTVDEDYFQVYQMDLIAGEPFAKGDPMTHAVVNRQVTEIIGFENPEEALGERIKYGSGTLEFQIVGVVEDFHAGSLHRNLENVLMANVPWNKFQAGIKLKGTQSSFSDIKKALNHIEESWEKSFPDHVFDFQFYDEELASMYALERSVSQVFNIFVTMAILIGALGLYGLVSFMANQKTKEIGIRKVMGASELSILNIFSKEFVMLLLLAFVIAAPVSYFLMNAFLEMYAYRISIGPQFFILAIVVSTVVALLTVGFKSMKVARANPVISLRDD